MQVIAENISQGKIIQHSDLLDALPANPLLFAPWAEFPYRPEVSFAIAHTGTELLLKFFVTEKYLVAKYLQTNDPVYRDSCVEMFISFDGKRSYYNIEHNSSGVCLASYRPEAGAALQMLPKEIIETIRTYSVIEPAETDSAQRHWSLTIEIPVAFFLFHPMTSLRGVKSHANFYKCGDDLLIPHYLCWNNIEAPVPNFHLPQFFGDLHFK